MTQPQPKAALIAGVTSQDGTYPAEFLIEKGCVVQDIERRNPLFSTARITQATQPGGICNLGA